MHYLWCVANCNKQSLTKQTNISQEDRETQRQNWKQKKREKEIYLLKNSLVLALICQIKRELLLLLRNSVSFWQDLRRLKVTPLANFIFSAEANRDGKCYQLLRWLLPILKSVLIFIIKVAFLPLQFTRSTATAKRGKKTLRFHNICGHKFVRLVVWDRKKEREREESSLHKEGKEEPHLALVLAYKLSGVS